MCDTCWLLSPCSVLVLRLEFDKGGKEKLSGLLGCDERRQETVNGLIFSNVCARNIWSCWVC